MQSEDEKAAPDVQVDNAEGDVNVDTGSEPTETPDEASGEDQDGGAEEGDGEEGGE